MQKESIINSKRDELIFETLMILVDDTPKHPSRTVPTRLLGLYLGTRRPLGWGAAEVKHERICAGL